MNNIAYAIRRMAQTGKETTALICTVDAVDKKARTIDCTPLDEGAPLLGVNLQANQQGTVGLVAWPRVGSYVVVGFVAGGSAGVVLMTDDIESMDITIGTEDGTALHIDERGVTLTAQTITLNGGSLGGLINIAHLTDKLNALVDTFNNHTHTLDVGTVAVVGSSSAQQNAAPITVPAVSSKADKLDRADYEDTNVKH